MLEPVVAVGTSQLFGTNHQHGIDRGPDGVPLNVPDTCDPDGLAWTGTTNKGEPHINRCDDFLNGDLQVLGMTGKLRGTGTGWSEQCPVSCSVSLRLYCFQQP